MTDTRRNLLVAILVFAAAVAFLAWTYTYPPLERMMPVLVGWIGVVLTLLDVVAHIDSRFGRLVAMALSGTAHLQAEESGGISRVELTAFLWMVAGLTLIVVVGFLPAALIYVFAYMAVQGGKSLRQAGLTAVCVTLFIWLMFEYLMEYEVYRGLLFES